MIQTLWDAGAGETVTRLSSSVAPRPPSRMLWKSCLPARTLCSQRSGHAGPVTPTPSGQETRSRYLSLAPRESPSGVGAQQERSRLESPKLSPQAPAPRMAQPLPSVGFHVYEMGPRPSPHCVEQSWCWKEAWGLGTGDLTRVLALPLTSREALGKSLDLPDVSPSPRHLWKEDKRR